MAMAGLCARTCTRGLALLGAVLGGAQVGAQELVYSTGTGFGGPSGLVVIPDIANGLAASSPIFIDPVGGYTINPHGFTLIGPMTAVATHMPDNYGPGHRVDVIDIATASLSTSFYPGGAGDIAYSGIGTAIINPAGTHLLLATADTLGGSNRLLWVIPTPLSSLSIASDILIMPGDFGTAQTHAIAFDPGTGRAYVAHSNGVTAIDPPYHAANVAFTIPLPPVSYLNLYSRDVALSPDSSTLLLTTGGATPGTNAVTILHAPFSASSLPELLPIEHASELHAIAFTPDGSQALAVDFNTSGGQAQVFAIAAPYSTTSSVQWMQLPPGGQNASGFEDIEISPNGRIAALGGGCAGDGCPLIILRAPFTKDGFAVETMNVPPQYPFPYIPTGRGTGTVHFWPTPIVPRPQIRVDSIAVTEGNSGTRPATFTVSLSNPSTQTVTVDYVTADSQAQAGSDYIATSGTLSFAPGQTRKTVDVPVIGDTLTESDEYFRLNLSNPVNAGLFSTPTTRDGLCLIVNDDGGTPYIATDPPLPDAYVGVPYAQTFTAANTSGAPTWAVASPNFDLVGGLTMAGASGVLSGIPVQAGAYDFNVYLVGLNVTRQYHLNVRLDRIFADGFEAPPGMQER